MTLDEMKIIRNYLKNTDKKTVIQALKEVEGCIIELVCEDSFTNEDPKCQEFVVEESVKEKPSLMEDNYLEKEVNQDVFKMTTKPVTLADLEQRLNNRTLTREEGLGLKQRMSGVSNYRGKYTTDSIRIWTLTGNEYDLVKTQ